MITSSVLSLSSVVFWLACCCCCTAQLQQLSAFGLPVRSKSIFVSSNTRIIQHQAHPIIFTRLLDIPDGSNLESLQRLPNVTITMATKEINSKASSKTNPSFGGTESLDLGRSTWTKNFYNYAKAAAGSLGDIMSADSLEDEEDATTTTTSSAVTTTPTNNNNSATVPKTLKSQSDRQSSCSTGLVTTPIPSGSLAKQFGIHHPLDRMALTANGNLQRLVSSYYDAPVQVLVDSCDLLLGDTATAAAAATTTTKAKSSNSLRRSSILNRPNMVSKEMKWDRIVHLSVHNQVRHTCFDNDNNKKTDSFETTT